MYCWVILNETSNNMFDNIIFIITNKSIHKLFYTTFIHQKMVDKLKYVQ